MANSENGVDFQQYQNFVAQAFEAGVHTEIPGKRVSPDSWDTTIDIVAASAFSEIPICTLSGDLGVTSSAVQNRRTDGIRALYERSPEDIRNGLSLEDLQRAWGQKPITLESRRRRSRGRGGITAKIEAIMNQDPHMSYEDAAFYAGATGDSKYNSKRTLRRWGRRISLANGISFEELKEQMISALTYEARLAALRKVTREFATDYVKGENALLARVSKPIIDAGLWGHFRKNGMNPFFDLMEAQEIPFAVIGHEDPRAPVQKGEQRYTVMYGSDVENAKNIFESSDWS